MTASETAYRLIYDSLKYRGGQVALRGTVVDKRLYIRLCKHSASCGYRIYNFVLL